MKKVLIILTLLSAAACSHSPARKVQIQSNQDKNCINEHYQVVRCEKIKYLTQPDENGVEKRVTISF